MNHSLLRSTLLVGSFFACGWHIGMAYAKPLSVDKSWPLDIASDGKVQPKGAASYRAMKSALYDREYSVSDTAKTLPPAIRQYYARYFRVEDSNRIFAEGQEKWVTGCMRRPGQLGQHLFYTAAAQPFYIVGFEQGGYGLNECADIIRLDKNGAIEAFWHLQFFSTVKSLEDLRVKVRDGKGVDVAELTSS